MCLEIGYSAWIYGYHMFRQTYKFKLQIFQFQNSIGTNFINSPNSNIPMEFWNCKSCDTCLASQTLLIACFWTNWAVCRQIASGKGWETVIKSSALTMTIPSCFSLENWFQDVSMTLATCMDSGGLNDISWHFNGIWWYMSMENGWDMDEH